MKPCWTRAEGCGEVLDRRRRLWSGVGHAQKAVERCWAGEKALEAVLKVLRLLKVLKVQRARKEVPTQRADRGAHTAAAGASVQLGDGLRSGREGW